MFDVKETIKMYICRIFVILNWARIQVPDQD